MLGSLLRAVYAALALLMLAACNPAGSTGDENSAAPERSDRPAAASAPLAAAKPTGSPPAVKWKAEMEGRLDPQRVLPDGRLLATRGPWELRVYSAEGQLLEPQLPPPLSRGEEWQSFAFADDGSYFTMISKTEFWKPGDPLYELSAWSTDGDLRWSKMLLPETGGDGMLWPLGDLLYIAARGRLSCFDGEGDELWHSDMEESYLRPAAAVGEPRFYCCNAGTANCYGARGELLWTYTSSALRREFQHDRFGNCYAMLKSPDRLIKVDPDGQLAWTFDISAHAEGEYNGFFEYGHAHGSYLDVDDAGCVYFVDNYNSLNAVTADGKHRWTVVDPMRTMGLRSGPDSILDYPDHPVVGPNGCVYFTSGNRLCAVDAQGQVLFVDDRFAELFDPPVVGPDGTVYIASDVWLYALEPQTGAAEKLPEQQQLIEAERQRQAERELEWAAEREEFEQAREEAEQRGETIDPFESWQHELPPDPPGSYLCDRSQVAEIIIAELNGYHSVCREYPPYLIGGKSNEDPLIQRGYLRGYPLVWPQPGCHCMLPMIGTDDRGYVRWACAVSTPGTPGDTPVAGSARGLALGGLTAREPGVMGYGLSAGYELDSTLCYFGYQRGEWLGGDEQTCWLWLYGSNIWPEQNPDHGAGEGGMQAMEYFDLFSEFSYAFGGRGLDLLNAGTGELAPDGIPDGICLLYKLERGQLASTIRAKDI